MIDTINIPAQNPTIYFHYMENETNFLKINIKDKTFLIPSHIPDQVVVIEVIWNNEKYITYFGIRSPERRIGS